MRVGVVGNRSGWEYKYVKVMLVKLGVSTDDVIISGGADGVDELAEEFAREFGCKMVIYYPKMFVNSPERYFSRNKEIARDCDMLVAFDKTTKSSGTKNTIKHAEQFGKRVVIFRTDEDDGS